MPIQQNGLQGYIDSANPGAPPIFIAQGQAPPPGYQIAMGPAGQPVAAPVSTGATPVGGAPVGAIVPGAVSTAVTGQTTINATEEQKNLVVFNDLPTAQDVAAALNSLGVTPRDVMAIFQEIKEAGALQAELVVH